MTEGIYEFPARKTEVLSMDEIDDILSVIFDD